MEASHLGNAKLFSHYFLIVKETTSSPPPFPRPLKFVIQKTIGEFSSKLGKKLNLKQEKKNSQFFFWLKHNKSCPKKSLIVRFCLSKLCSLSHHQAHSHVPTFNLLETINFGLHQ
jgi:hypothetical protein